MIKTIILILLVINLNGCGKEEETFKTVSYYEKNKEIRKHRIIECKELNKMTTTIEKDCNNANKAEKNSKKSKSIDWGTESF